MKGTGFGIYLVTEKKKIRLPVNPTEITVQCEGDNTNYNVAGVGEIVIPRHAKLSVVNFESFFPRNYFTTLTTVEEWFTPEFYVNFILRLQSNREVFQIIINRYDGDRLMFDTSFPCVISSFSYTDKGGEAGDIYYSIGIQEHRDAKPGIVEVVAVDASKDVTYLTETPQRPVPNTEIVVGDSVTVSGPVYETEDQSLPSFRQARKHVLIADKIVSRVLPPDSRSGMHKVFISGLGWVDKSDCIKGNIENTISRVEDLS